jgi:hypothetical protein
LVLVQFELHFRQLQQFQRVTKSSDLIGFAIGVPINSVSVSGVYVFVNTKYLCFLHALLNVFTA